MQLSITIINRIDSGIDRQFIFSFPGRPATYQGDVLKGKRNGFGVFKSGRTPIIYSGEWTDGKRNGKGKMIYDTDGKTFYEGDWVNNKKFGWGIYHYASGNDFTFFSFQLFFFSVNSLNLERPVRWAYLNKNEMFAALGNFGAEPNPPYVASPN